jgi:hypothetical protein
MAVGINGDKIVRDHRGLFDLDGHCPVWLQFGNTAYVSKRVSRPLVSLLVLEA